MKYTGGDVYKRTLLVIACLVFAGLAIMTGLNQWGNGPTSKHASVEQRDPEIPHSSISAAKQTAKFSDTPGDESADKSKPQPTHMDWISRPNWQLSGLYREHIDELKLRFAQGDQRAGFILAANALRCNRAASSQEQLEQKIQRATEYVDAQATIDREMNRFEFCQGIELSERQAHLDYFSTLAASGYVPALEVIGSIPDKLYMQYSHQADLPRDEYIARRDAFQKQKYGYLNQAASQGSLYALQRLSYINSHQPDLLEPGQSSVSVALANTMTLLHFSQDNTTYNRAQFQQNRLYDMVSAEELETAQQLSKQFVDKIENSGQLYTAMENDKSVFTFY